MLKTVFKSILLDNREESNLSAISYLIRNFKDDDTIISEALNKLPSDYFGIDNEEVIAIDEVINDTLESICIKNDYKEYSIKTYWTKRECYSEYEDEYDYCVFLAYVE